MTRLLVRIVATLLCCLSSVLLRAAEPVQAAVGPELEIQILFDNTSAREDLRRGWGFSALIDFRGHRVLFDSGSDPILLLEHLELMQIDPKSIEHAIISHEHGDHLRGVYWVFEKNPNLQVHFLDCFPEEAFRRAKGVKMVPHRITGPFEFTPGIFSTGIVDGLPAEQSLAIETSLGPVMLVGCSHPGIVKLVQTVQTQRQKNSIRYLLGGFHLLRKEPQDIKATINQLQDLNVQSVSPAHCSGDLAIEMFQTLYGPQFHSPGVGRRIVIDNGQLTVTTLPVKEQASNK
ncbi:MAG: MBL fold metallo-hydrolase [Planctomycetaceae bacterium]|nr:MBL fold metallo-hydrolase [Planctomycetaceae bacterium]